MTLTGWFVLLLAIMLHIVGLSWYDRHSVLEAALSASSASDLAALLAAAAFLGLRLGLLLLGPWLVACGLLRTGRAVLAWPVSADG